MPPGVWYYLTLSVTPFWASYEEIMANIKQQKKRIGQDIVRRERNQSVKSRMRTYMKKTYAALETTDKEVLKTLLPEALSEIDKAASKGVIHPNSAARKKSSLQRRFAKLA